jgi:hypothetical protein
MPVLIDGDQMDLSLFFFRGLPRIFKLRLYHVLRPKMGRLASAAAVAVVALSLAPVLLQIALALLPGLALLPFLLNARMGPYCSAWAVVRDAKVKLRQRELEDGLAAKSR